MLLNVGDTHSSLEMDLAEVSVPKVALFLESASRSGRLVQG